MNVTQYRHAIFRKMPALNIPTPAVLCLAAILGSICNLIAVTKVHTADKATATSAEFLLIIPTNSQTHISLPLPVEPAAKTIL